MNRQQFIPRSAKRLSKTPLDSTNPWEYNEFKSKYTSFWDGVSGSLEINQRRPSELKHLKNKSSLKHRDLKSFNQNKVFILYNISNLFLSKPIYSY